MAQATNFLEEIKTLFKNSGKSSTLLNAQLNRCTFQKIRQDLRAVHSRSLVIQLMILMKLMDIPTIHRFMSTEFQKFVPFGKDLLYRIKKNCKINWRKILLTQSYKSGGEIEQEGKEDASAKTCFIIDDTDLPKRGKCIEFIGRIYSHVTHKYGLGFKCLNLAYWSGKHLLHVDFTLHVEPGKLGNQGMSKKDLNKRYCKERKAESAGYSRTEELFEKKTDSAIKMLRRAMAQGFKAAYILADSWFFSQKLVNFAIQRSIHLVTRPKFNHWKYMFEGKNYTMGELVKKVRYNKRKWNRKLRMHHVTATIIFKAVHLKVFFYKEKKRGSKWQAIITTDKSLGANQAYEIYQNRWTIEVSYKELKQHLGFGKCSSRDFDAQISDITMCLAAYNHLSQVKAVNDYQSIGNLFDEISRQQLSPTLMQRFWNELYAAIQEIAALVDTNFDVLLKRIITSTTFAKNWQRVNLLLTSET